MMFQINRNLIRCLKLSQHLHHSFHRIHKRSRSRFKRQVVNRRRNGIRRRRILRGPNLSLVRIPIPCFRINLLLLLQGHNRMRLIPQQRPKSRNIGIIRRPLKLQLRLGDLRRPIIVNRRELRGRFLRSRLRRLLRPVFLRGTQLLNHPREFIQACVRSFQQSVDDVHHAVPVVVD